MPGRMAWLCTGGFVGSVAGGASAGGERTELDDLQAPHGGSTPIMADRRPSEPRYDRLLISRYPLHGVFGSVRAGISRRDADVPNDL
jgi:hypothetical protein